MKAINIPTLIRTQSRPSSPGIRSEDPSHFPSDSRINVPNFPHTIPEHLSRPSGIPVSLANAYYELLDVSKDEVRFIRTLTICAHEPLFCRLEDDELNESAKYEALFCQCRW